MWILLAIVMFALGVLGWSLHFAFLGHLIGCRFRNRKSKNAVSMVAIAGSLIFLTLQTALEPLVFTMPVWIAVLVLGPAPFGFALFYFRYEAWNVGVRNTYFKPQA